MHTISTTVTVKVWGTELSKTATGYSTKVEGFFQEHAKDLDRAARVVRRGLEAVYPPSVTERDVTELRGHNLADFQKVEAIRVVLGDDNIGAKDSLKIISQIVGGVS